MAKKQKIQADPEPETPTSPVSELQFLKGVGPRRAQALAEQGVRTVRDLLLFVPRKYLDRRSVLPLRQIRLQLAGEEGLPDGVTSIVEVKRMQLFQIAKGRFRLLMRVGDPTGEASLVFFQGAQYFVKMFQPGDILAINGAPEVYNSSLQWVHPEMEKIEQEEAQLIHSGRIIPQYSEPAVMKSAGLGTRTMRTLIQRTLDEHGEKELTETLPAELLERYQLMPLAQAVRNIHFPESEELLERARYRMKFEELFFFELGLALRKEITRNRDEGIVFNVHSALARALLDKLGFTLTGAQVRVLRELCADMESTRAMNRLIQGDVGSGKTIVALLAMLIAVDNGYQCAFMAPTELLAEQHFHTLQRFLEGLPVKVAQLIGGQKKRMRENMLYDIRNGVANIVVGTHALFQEQVEYKNLGLVVIDEQHRFGVEQRAMLKNKGLLPDTLIMTATPIPRTLTMTLYGDLDVSVIDELPAGRRPVQTSVRFESQLEEVWEFVQTQVEAGRQAYIVYPLVEKSEKLELKSAVEHFEFLKSAVFSGRQMGLIHGQMLWYEKEDAMREFLERRTQVLVATTVIEVGIDVANATVMVVENAERFGLSQLHQLRGRVGRGADQSYCILLTKDNYRYALRSGLSQNDLRQERRAAIRRLNAMVETSDGFKISEIDLELRGPGDFMGTRQSGLPEFRHANLVTDGPLIVLTREAAFAVAEEDPELELPKNATLKFAVASAVARSMKYADVG